MAEFLRPEARAALWRWRELYVALALLVVGLWWGITTFGILKWLGIAMVITSAALAVAAIQRGRFRQGAGGAGVVQIDERRLSYFGPLTGGVIDMDDVTQLELDASGKPPHWVLTAPGAQRLAIPVDAEGADTLFDLFATLPGIRTGGLLDALSRTGNVQVIIWQRGAPRLH